MITQIHNKNGHIVYECAGGLGYDHGYWITLDNLDKLTKRDKDQLEDWEDYQYAEYYGEKYRLVEIPEDDDKVCYACNRPLPKKEVKEREYDNHEITLTEMFMGKTQWNIRFS